MKKLFILLVLSLLVFASACEEQNSNSDSSKKGTDKTFLSGDSSIDIKFTENAPPDEVYDGGNEQFQINLNVENKGEWDIDNPNNIQFKISGIDTQDFDNPALIITSSPIALKGAKLDTSGSEVRGSVTNVAFPNFKYANEVKGSVSFNLIAEACYSYGTKAVTKICFKEDPFDDDENVCTVSEEKPVEVSRGPIDIYDLKEAPYGNDQISISFKVKHVGEGELYQLGTNCEAENDEIEKKNKVLLEVSGVDGITCPSLHTAEGENANSAKGHLTLYPTDSGTQEAFVTCTMPSAVSGDFEKVLDFTAKYDYLQKIKKKITVKHLG